MICPSCKNEIADGSIICPICNTQFAFNVPGTTQTSNPNLYEVVENNNAYNNNPYNNNFNYNNNMNGNAVEESAFSPVEHVIPTEVNHYPEEEIDPSINAAKYSNVQHDNNQEFMHINGKNIEEPYDPSATTVSPLRPEAPMGQGNMMSQNGQIPNSFGMMQGQMMQPMGTQAPMTTPMQPTAHLNMPNNNMVNTPPQGQQSTNNNMVQNNNQAPLNNANNNKNNNAPQPEKAGEKPNVVVINQPNKEKKKIKGEDIFFGAVSLVGIALFIIIAISLLTGSPTEQGPIAFRNNGNVYDQTIRETDNVGNKSTFNYPMSVGDTTLASIFDTLNQTYVDVDVKGIRFIEGTEAQELAKNYANEALIEGFTWYAFEYQVKFNDLKSLTGTGISPVLNSKVYLWNGCDFVTYNEKHYSLKSYNVYGGGNILNTQTATIQVVYQIPASEKEYSICMGYLEKTMGCFSKYQT